MDFDSQAVSRELLEEPPGMFKENLHSVRVPRTSLGCSYLGNAAWKMLPRMLENARECYPVNRFAVGKSPQSIDRVLVGVLLVDEVPLIRKMRNTLA